MENTDVKLRNRGASVRIGQTFGVLSIVVAGVLGFAGGAFAAPRDITVPADPTGGAMDSSQSYIQTWVIDHAVPVLFGLLLLGVAIRLAVKYFRRAAKAA